MLQVFADSFDVVRSDFIRVPIADVSADGGAAAVLDSVHTAALTSTALTPDLSFRPAIGNYLHNDMLVRPVDDAFASSHLISVDQTDSFRFPQTQLSSGLIHVPSPQVSPTQEQEVTFIAGVDASGNVAAESLAAWNSGTNPATYKTNTTEAKWGATTAGTAGGTVTYFFDAGSAWTATEQSVFLAAYALWSDIANIQFTAAADATSANILIKRSPLNGGAHFDGKLSSFDANPGLVGQNVLWNYNTSGDGNPAHQSSLNIETTDVAGGFGPLTADPNVAGGHAWGTVVHEEGHSLGLGHGGPYNGNVVASQQQYSAQDMELWTVMSYINPTTASPKYLTEYPVTGTNWGTSADGFARSAETPMMLDILAAQRLYGAATTGALSTGQTFGFHCTIADASKPFFDFTVNTNPVITIWSSAANNTLDLSGYATSSTVNLNAGQFSSCDGLTNNIGIALNTQINGFVGGTGADTVTGNNNGDLMDGSFGGNDSFTGGTGNDGFYFAAAFTTADFVNGASGSNDQVALKGDYSGGITITGTQLQNVEVLAMQAGFNYNITLADSVATGASFAVWAIAVGSGNTVTVNASAEATAAYSFFMGQGNDTVIGGSGADLIYGEGGKDTLTGGAGADTFAYFAASNSTSSTFDVITDFNVGAGDKIKLVGFTAISGVDATIGTGVLTTAAFDTTLAAAVNGTNLAANHAVLYTPTGPDFAGHTFMIVDLNGVAGYQASADLVIDVTGGTLAGLAAGTFV